MDGFNPMMLQLPSKEVLTQVQQQTQVAQVQQQTQEVSGAAIVSAKPPLFRFKLDDSIVELISYFAKNHMMDDRKTYKTEWNIYYESHREVFDREIQRLTELGYNNKEPIKDKLFKAGRYYFRKKNLSGDDVGGISNKHYNDDDTDHYNIKQEEEYEYEKRENIVHHHHKKIRMDKNILSSFDKHISQMSNMNKIQSPDKSFENYCKNNINEIANEIVNIINKHDLSVTHMNIKLKETYRNRYFNIIRKRTALSSS